MNIFKSILNKIFTAEQWKKGSLITYNAWTSDEGAVNPFKDSSLVYVAASKIAENLPQAPLTFYNSNTSAKLGMDAPIVRLFRQPNPNSTYFTFFEELTLYLSLYGETFFWIGDSVGQRVGTSTVPGELVVLLPTRMQHVIDTNGNLVGWTYDTGKTKISLTKDEVMQVKFPNPYNPYRGLAPIDSARNDVDSDYLASKYSKSFFQNGANPGIVFTRNEDDESSDEEIKSFLQEWNANRKGASKQYKAAVLNSGMDVKKVGLSQEEMDYIKQRAFNAERILSVFGVPPPMAGFYEQATYGNVKTAKRIFWNETIKTYARRYESALNNFFLPKYASGVVCKFGFQDIDELKHDAKETADIVNIYANHGIPMNALIDAFELPFEHQEGLDIGYQPLTNLPVGTNFIEEQKKDTPASSDSKEVVSTTPSIYNEFSKNLHNYLHRQRAKILKNIANDKIMDDEFWEKENDRLIAKFDPIYGELQENLDNLVKINNFNRKFVEKAMSKDKNAYSDNIRDLYNKFNKKLGTMQKSRVSAIAERETSLILEQTNIGESKDADTNT